MREVTFEVARHSLEQWHVAEDSVVCEVNVDIHLNDENMAALAATPEHLLELAVGHLFCRGLIDHIADIESAAIDNNSFTVHISLSPDAQMINEASRGRRATAKDLEEAEILEPLQSEFRVAPSSIALLIQALHDNSLLYRSTGGAHSAALGNEHGIIAMREDIGRNNAIDKLIGHCLLQGVDATDTVLVTSGRAFSETVVRAYKIGAPILASPSAPTNRAVSLADQLGITLVGFVRQGRLNAYTAHWRVWQT